VPPKILKALTCAALASACYAGAAGASAPPRAELRASVCHRALDPPARFVRVTAVMRPLPGTRAMALKFELLRKLRRGAPWAVVSGHDLGKWISPTNPSGLGQLPGDVWKLLKPVFNLAAPAAYRFRVSFRWSGAHGRVLSQVTQKSPRCYQPELRPDLAVLAPVVLSATSTPGIDQYSVRIVNNGATGAGPFSVRFTDGTVVKGQAVTRLGPHQTLDPPLTFLGPACTSGTPGPKITVDPNHQVDDYNRYNNSLIVICPSVSGSTAAKLRRR
jgi:hypothetical protein